MSWRWAVDQCFVFYCFGVRFLGVRLSRESSLFLLPFRFAAKSVGWREFPFPPLSKTQHLAFFGPRLFFFGLLFGGLSMLLTVLWLVGSLLNTLLLVQGGVDQGVPVRGAENWQPDQEEEFRIMGALSGLQRKIVGATAQLDEIDTEAGASSRTKQVPLLPPPSYRCYL